MSRTMKAYLLIFAAVLLAGAAAAPAQVDKRPMTFEDVLKIKRVGDPQWSPDGREVLYTVREVDLEKDRYVTHIWRIRIGEKAPQPMTNGEQGERSPRWAPDGKRFAFLANRDGKTQIWLMARNGGEARKFTEHPNGVIAFEWAPDGKSIAFTAYPEEKSKRPSDVKVVDKQFRYAQLYVIDVESRQARRVVEGKPARIGHIREFEWSPDGQQLAFTAAKTPRVQDYITSEIYLY
ncbi:MAG: hypothetical protein Q9P14_10605 [candidate division KSB1 bacterium]|nr:hypothetical protein [candidate division KSB1 bacterium]MDQ7066403.1 hypothetical protein [candidate division KSB1 bacterium]